jgi:hypothetical protein
LEAWHKKDVFCLQLHSLAAAVNWLAFVIKSRSLSVIIFVDIDPVD